MRYEALQSEIGACMVLNTADGKPKMDTFADLDFPNILGNRRAKSEHAWC